MINLMKQPFFLSEKDIEWVENTKKHMTLEEKIGQLFVPHRRNHVSVRKGRGDAADTSVSSGK